ncbi:protein kinase [Streptomyces sp. NPDC060198]|uniref:protein kinase domain-containing protein n=1 Tax=Streptomyces sp. NPDC060198 TaxID=3347070 RepID=UPI0036530F87
MKVLQEAGFPAQAVVLRVRDLEGPTPDLPLVLKWYHRLHAPEPAVVALLGDQPGPLERRVESGVADGHPYHLHRSHGETHLGQYLREHPGAMRGDQLDAVVRQLHSAVAFLHAHDVVHRDISPDNIMVEAHAHGIELVLIDFGVAVHRPDERSQRSAWRGKPLYLAPEAGSRHQTVSEAGDWWSVGMVIAELALGKHPVDFRDDEAVLAEIATHDPDVGGIEDRRIRMLCQGLLTRAPEYRWAGEQVAAWLAGESPEIAPRRTGAPSDEREKTVEPFAFLGESFMDTERLAWTLDHYHVAADRMLAAEESRFELVRWLEQFETVGTRRAEERDTLRTLRAELAGPPTPELTVRLLNWLGPRLHATCWGMPLTVRGIRDLSRVAQEGDGGALQLVEHLRRHPGILTALAERPDGDDLHEVAERWRTLRERWPHLVRELRRSPDLGRVTRVGGPLRQTAALDARLLELAREPARVAARLATATMNHRDGLPAAVPWFDRLLATPDDPLRLLAALLLAPRAAQEAEARRARLLDEAAERLMEEDRDGVIAVMRSMDRLPTLGWALMGATAATAPWCFVIGLADVLGRAPQEAVVVAWLLTLPAAAAVFATELLTAIYIGPPAYHPRRSLAALLIRTAERPAALALSRRLATLLPAALLLLGLVLIGFRAVTATPWLWPVATVALLVGWSLHRCRQWRRERRERRARRVADPRHRPDPRPSPAPRTTGAEV